MRRTVAPTGLRQHLQHQRRTKVLGASEDDANSTTFTGVPEYAKVCLFVGGKKKKELKNNNNKTRIRIGKTIDK